ncbi:MAG: NADH:flavin oxidoreductase [Gammaproteobacteria bacterium]|nr:NADH:flavin oxidoreductase [Gammaproteobacteria bacterium]
MSSLFTPFDINGMALANRIVMAPMTRNKSPGGIPTDDNIEYYRRRAEGGAGLIVTEAACIGHRAASGYPDVPFLDGDAAMAGWRKVVNAVHGEGGKIAAQLWHVGAIRRPGVEPGGDTPGYSPSGMLVPGKVTGHAMTKSDIEEVTQAYITAAVASKNAGFDAIEIHGAHSYLIDQFFWPGTNQRADEYGGNLEGRSRFGLDIIRGIRAAVGKGFPVLIRLSQWKQQDFNAKLVDTPYELEQFLTPMVDAGIDAFHLSQRRFWEPEFEGSDLNLAGWAKKLTGKPSITVGSVSLDADFVPEPGDTAFKEGNIASLDGLLQRLDAEEFDLVAVGRAMIANPDWANKVQAGQWQQLQPYRKEMLASLL